MRKIPPEFELRAQPADGAGFFHCIATAVSDPPDKQVSAAQLRAETIARVAEIRRVLLAALGWTRRHRPTNASILPILGANGKDGGLGRGT